MPFEIKIAPGRPEPIYLQIEERVRLGIAQGLLKTGDQLPSVRILATQLLVNPNTVAKAYSNLQRAGLLESQRGKGLFVSRLESVFNKTEREKRLAIATERFIADTLDLGFSEDALVSAIRAQLDNRIKKQ